MGMVRVQCKDRIISGALYSTLYECISNDRMLEYFLRKLVSSPDMVNTINFSSFMMARKQVQTGLNNFITKWLTNTLATGLVLQ
jgi:hypothetical protein